MDYKKAITDNKHFRSLIIILAILMLDMLIMHPHLNSLLGLIINPYIKGYEFSSLQKRLSSGTQKLRIYTDANDNQMPDDIAPQTPKKTESPTKPRTARIVYPKNIIHTVKKGETLFRISKSYGIPINILANANKGLNIATISIGQRIIIPQSYTNYKLKHRSILYLPEISEPLEGYCPEEFEWPTIGARKISSGYGYRWNRIHGGIDIPKRTGAPILASNSGRVIFAGPKGGYGLCVIISHGHGVKTLYGHASKILVIPGESVTKGQKIADVGSTGDATGPHIHFEVIVNHIPINPEIYLSGPATLDYGITYPSTDHN